MKYKWKLNKNNVFEWKSIQICYKWKIYMKKKNITCFENEKLFKNKIEQIFLKDFEEKIEKN